MSRKLKFILAFILLDCLFIAGVLFWCREIMSEKDLYATIGGVMLLGLVSIVMIAVDQDDDNGSHGGYG